MFFRSLRSAWGAGWRAGMADPRVIPALLEDRPVKYLEAPACPFRRWWQFFVAENWHSGYGAGVAQRIDNWIKERR